MISRRAVALVALVAAAGAFASLGSWQVRRGHERQAYLDGLAAQAPQAERGEYLADRQLLLDGQAHEGQPGYHVWTPLKLASGELLIVDRGWIPAAPAANLAAPSGPQELAGHWRPLPRPAIRLAAPAPACPATQFPLLVEYPTVADLRCALGASVRDGVLRLEPSAPGGFVRDWSESGFAPARHYAYAAQWFGLCAVAVVILLRMLRK